MKHYLLFTAVIVLACGLALTRMVAPVWVIAPLVLLWLLVVGLGVAFLPLKTFVPAVTQLPTDEPVIALTYDDGPDPRTTPALLDLLDELEVKAAFFCIGLRVREQPDLARQIVERGHLIANHSDRHAWCTPFGLSVHWQRKIEQCQTTIAKTTGVNTRFFRPPMGLTNPHLASALARTEHICIGWSIRSLDTRGASDDSVAKRVARRLRPGAIVLLHDGGLQPQRVLALTRRIVKDARQRGYRIARLDQHL